MKTIACNLRLNIICIVILLSAVFLWGCGEKTVKPGTFSYSGGSGRVEISCEEVTVQGKNASARIVFSSPNYTYVKVDDVKYEGKYTEDTSTFVIPAVLDKEFQIIGCTTAMSTPHEIEYTLFISLDKNDGNSETDNADAVTEGNTSAADSVVKRGFSDNDAPVLEGLSFEKRLETEYAECFDVFYYDKGFKVISVADGSSYLIVPEGKPIPEGLQDKLPDKMTVISSPHNIYLAATGAMSLFDALSSLDSISFTGTDTDGWYIDAPKKALENGFMTYAGKYRAPDFELLLNGDCGLAIESTMILHSPEIKEQLINIGIPVFTDYSSYEKTAAGKGEWIYAYAAMLNKEDRADKVFAETLKAMKEYDGYEKKGKKIALFYISNAGLAVIRSDDDYITDLIRRGGGENAFAEADFKGDDNAGLSLSMEDFYDMAVDADYLIYNATIDGSVSSVSDLKAKYGLISDFKAVKENNVYILNKEFYQSTISMYKLAGDIDRMISGNYDGMVFLRKMT